MVSTEPLAPPARSGQFLLLHEKDNILICASPGRAGSAVLIDGTAHVLTSDIQLGHKIARVALAEGDKVYRYGIAIGSMTEAVHPGEHVHSHNLKSDYIPAHGRDAVRIREIRS